MTSTRRRVCIEHEPQMLPDLEPQAGCFYHCPDVTNAALLSPEVSQIHWKCCGHSGFQDRSQERRVICYLAGNAAPITRDDVVGIVEMLHNVPRNTSVDFLLHTGGGDIDAAEKIVNLLRTAVGTGRLRVIVPDFAKSAGTLIALAADKIVMSDSSELGPIDPQFLKKDGDGNARWLSVLSYLKAYENPCERLRTAPDDVPARIMISKLDPTTVVQFEAISKRARTLAEEHLSRWMFQQKKANYTKIAGDLMNTNLWPAHGQMISWEDAKQMELEVQYFSQRARNGAITGVSSAFSG